MQQDITASRPANIIDFMEWHKAHGYKFAQKFDEPLWGIEAFGDVCHTKLSKEQAQWIYDLCQEEEGMNA